MSVHAVAFHPSRPLIGSAGADSLTKIFGQTRNSINQQQQYLATINKTNETTNT